MDEACLWNNGPFFSSIHLAHIAGNALSIWQQATPPYLTVWHHSPCLTWHSLIAWLPTLSSPLSYGLCHAASTTSPTFVSLRFSLEGRQCPFLGTKHWKEQHRRTQISPRHSCPVFRKSSRTSASLKWVFFMHYYCLNTQLFAIWAFDNTDFVKKS